MIRELTKEQLRETIGSEVIKSDWIEVTQDRINEFADCTGDHQWIHVDEDKASMSPFGKPIAHGFLVLSLMAPRDSIQMYSGQKVFTSALRAVIPF